MPNLAGWAWSDRVRESFVLAPLAGMVGFTLLAVATAAFDAVLSAALLAELGAQGLHGALVPVVESANAVLATAGPATLTVLGVVFSITLVALQMATGQLSPRVMYLFTRSWTTKLTLTVFLGTFIYTLGVRYLGGLLEEGEGPFLPLLSTAVAMVLVVASLAAFVFFVDGAVNMMRATSVLDRVGRRTLAQIRAVARAAGEGVEPGPAPAGEPVTVRSGAEAGVLTGVDTWRLVRWAERNDAFVRVLPAVGDYIPAEAPVLRVWAAERPDRPERAAAALRTGSERSAHHDPVFGLRQVVDIGVRALSAAVNDPTTAVQCIDRVQPLVEEFAELPGDACVLCGRGGAPRVRLPLPGWENVVEVAFTELVLESGGQPQVSRRLMAALRDIEAAVPERRRPAVRARIEELRRVCARSLPREVLAFALAPDRQGLGGGR
ncbi:DUF2254 domain-containing protein [Nocardiopsis composta]|uniref:DUF2254 domain-containing protein n=1 Tax=Nocardiopsis composta TaxID=157465 RepID=UPI0028AE43DB|nr:DUF2254 domain-containing protein [Nocardiopsis composta]